jgi:ferredoxin-NADP reductase
MVFLAGFMLSEPLTQPPRGYQRMIFAGIVGILASAQIAWGSFLITPELALVIGNIFAFFCGQRAGVRLKLVGRRQLSRDQVEYRFESNHSLHYQAGQYMELQLPHIHADARGVRRSFTIAAAPDGNQLRIAVRHYTPSSTFKKALQTLPIGTILPVTGVYGDFILPKDPHAKVLLIAGGIGITPFRAQLEWLLKTGQSRDGVLLYSVTSEADVVFEDVLTAKEHGVATRVVTTPLDVESLKRLVPDIAEREVYVSGPPGMVDALTAAAKQLGAKKIHHDHFNGY